MHSSQIRTRSIRLFLPVALAIATPPALRSAVPDAVRDAPELSRGVSHTADGGTTTFIRVAPPSLPPPPAPLPSVSPRIERQSEADAVGKPGEMLSPVVTVYPAHAGLPVVSEIRWQHAGRDWRAFSSVDFFHLTQLSTIETATTDYTWFPFVSLAALGDRTRPVGLPIRPGQAEFWVDASAADIEAHPEAFATFQSLHALYQLEGPRLAAEHARREAEAAIQERKALARPKTKRPVIIRMWTPAETAADQR